MIKYIKGDLVKKAYQFDVIGHGCNCFLNFGAGIAKDVKQQFPSAYKADLKTQYGDKSKLGTYTSDTIGELTILNLYTQHRYGRGLHADYNAIRSCMKELKNSFGECKIGLPLIGAGLAGGDWETIEAIIEEELHGLDVTIVVWEKDEENLKKFGL